MDLATVGLVTGNAHAMAGRPMVLLLGIMALFAALTLSALLRVGAGWDEVTDLGIAKSYVESPLTGSPDDPTQARLPMFFVHLLAQPLGLSLATARYASVLVALLCLVGVYFYARECGDATTGLLACLLLAINPYFLAFARFAMTESGVYEGCLGIWVCYCLLRISNRVASVAAIGVLCGLLMSSKFTAVVPVALVFAALLASGASSRTESVIGLSSRWFRGVAMLLLAAALAFVLIMFVWLHGWTGGSPKTLAGGWNRALYLLAAGAYAAALTMLARRRRAQLSLSARFVLCVLLTLATLLVAPPEHFGNPRVLLSFGQRMVHPSAIEMTRLSRALFLVSCLLLKSGPVLGVVLLASPWVCLWTKRARGVVIVSVAGGAWLLVALATDWLQVFYVIPILPCLSVTAAVALHKLCQRRRCVGSALIAAILIGTGFDLVRSFPDVNLNGVQWLGGRVIADVTPVGYVAVGTVAFDGVVQTLQYVNDHASSSGTDRCVSYFPYHSAEHVVAYALPRRRFELIDGKLPRHSAAYQSATYVITTLETDTIALLGIDSFPHRFRTFGYTVPDAAILSNRFERVFTVQRKFGLAVASVWRRREEARIPTDSPCGGACPHAPDRAAISDGAVVNL